MTKSEKEAIDKAWVLHIGEREAGVIVEYCSNCH